MLLEIMFESPDGSNVWLNGPAKTRLQRSFCHCGGFIASHVRLTAAA